jgi:PAS domain S-box-containing protein
MRKSISQKVALGAGVILAAAVLAMCTTYFVSMSAIQAIRESHELSQTVLTTTAALEGDTVSGGLKVLQYLETGEIQHRQAYQQHSERIRQNADRLLTQSRVSEWKETGLVVAGKFQALDQLSLDIMARHEGGTPATAAQRAGVAKMLAMQEEALDLINTRVKPKLKLITNEADNKAASGMLRMLLLAGGMSLVLALLAVLAARYVRLSILSPIQRLAASADTVAAGDLSHRVELDADEEYMGLAKNFNHMVAELQNTTVSKTKHEDQATQLRALLDGVHDYAIFSIDDQGYITSWNAASTRILGYQAKDMEGVSFARIFKNTDEARTARDTGLATIAATGRFETDTQLVNEKGEAFEANMVVTPLSLGGSNVKGYSVVVRDITERLKAERRIEHLATKDALTGLSNRSMLMQQMQVAIARAARAHTQLVVMFIDLDKFKLVNDTLG